jgi:hypothetical protein
MLRLFRDRLRNERTWQVWLEVLADAAVSIPREHWRLDRHDVRFPVPMPRGFLVFSVMLGFGLGVAAAVADHSGISGMAQLLWFGPWVVLWLALFVSSFRRRLRWIALAAAREKACRTEVSTDSVTFSYPESAPQVLRRAEVTYLHDYGNVLRIGSGDPARDLWVSVHNPSYARIRAALGEWLPLTQPPLTSERTSRLLRRLGRLLDRLGMLGLLCMLGVAIHAALTLNKPPVLVAGAAVLNAALAILSWRRLPWLQRLLPLVSVAILAIPCLL